MITTVVGNYPKIPSLSGGPNLRRTITQFDEGQITAEELERVRDEATVDAIAEQIKAGLDLVTDGQLRWDDGQTYFAHKIKGFAITGLIRYFDTNTYYRQPVAEQKLQRNGPICVRDFQFAQEHSSKPVKPVITGPFTLAKLSATRAESYSSFRDFVLDLALILNQEARALQEAGAPIIQFDEPSILRAKGDFPLFREMMKSLTEGLKVKTALYTYFGDISGLPGFFELPFDVFGLDFVMGERNFEAVKSFPKEKELGFGIIDARNTKLETVDQIVEALRGIKPSVPLDRIHLNPSCGLEFLPRQRAFDKLVRMVEGARRAQEVLA